MTDTCERARGAPRLGVIGGTFDPPHMAHLVLAETARVQLSLDQVLFVPVGDPPHKQTEPITRASVRAALVEAAICHNSAFTLSRADLDRPGPHYTVDMLDVVHSHHPGAELYLLLGGDSLAEFGTWWRPERIVARACLAVMARPGSDVDLANLEEAVPGIRARIRHLDVPALDVSSTDLRRRRREGLPIRYLVPEAVVAYLQQHPLYVDNPP